MTLLQLVFVAQHRGSFRGSTARRGTSRSPQAIPANQFVAAVTDFSIGEPLNGVVEIAGPERVTLAGLVQRFLRATHDTRAAVEDPAARYFGAELQDDTLMPDANARLGAVNFDAWFGHTQSGR